MSRHPSPAFRHLKRSTTRLVAPALLLGLTVPVVVPEVGAQEAVTEEALREQL